MSEQSEKIGELVKALVEVQGSIKAAKKESENPYFKSKYADLGAVWDSCRSLLNKNGLAVIQTTEVVGDRVALVSTLAHTSGEWIKGRLLLMPVKNDPQGVGSAITYGRRYALSALLGIVSDEDDDGNAASMPQTRQTPRKSQSDPLPDVVKDAHTNAPEGQNVITERFSVSEPMKSKKTGNFYRKAVDSKQNSYYVHDESVIRELSIADGGEITVLVETKNGFTSIIGVVGV